MTYTKPETDTRFNIIPGEDIAVRAKKNASSRTGASSKRHRSPESYG